MIPDHPAKMPLDWLAEKLGQAPSALTGVSFEPIGTGQVGDSYRLHLDWAAGNASAPQTIVAKCPAANQTSRDTARQLHNYEVEVKWYQNFSEAAKIRTPKCLFAAIDEDIANFVLLMEDVAPAQQGDQLQGGSVDQLQLVLHELAHLHAFKWNDPNLATIDWLNYARGNREFIRGFVPAIYPEWRARYEARIASDILDMGAMLASRFDAYLVERNHVTTIVHGDCRLDNVLFADPSGRAIIVDWQTISAGNPMSDVAYLIGTSFTDATKRAAQEQSLVHSYLEQLAANGVSDYTAAWDDYRLGAFGGFVMAVVAAMLVERTPRGDEMFAVMAERSGAQALACDSLSLL
jgi:hypothetical protein